MRLSVIIVSYNVYPFLDNCLRSVRQALHGIPGEIIVVDNASVDQSPALVKQHFPDVHLIANTDNRGFAKANNQAIAIAQGEHILLLNPDTIVSEDTFTACLDFMDSHEDAGAIGVKMLDGSGQFLPESKRGLPDVLSSFLKMSGAYKLAPHSAKWNHYYQGHIGTDETAKTEVLCGAFMFIRKTALDTTGPLDEAFFMYGEDIDLSYRITQAGYSIYYLPVTSIIHYKGESTRKSSLNYILTFYEAMLIFTRKYPEFKGQQTLIKFAIYFQGLLQILRQWASRWWSLGLDAVVLVSSYYVVSVLWQQYYFHQSDYFRPSFFAFNLPLYSLIMIVSMYLNGAYDQPATRKTSWSGYIYGVILILVVYAFLPIHLRTSRMVIVLGSLLFLVWLWLTRRYLPPWNTSARGQAKQSDRKAIIIAGAEESARIRELINRSKDHLEVIGSVTPADDHSPLPAGFLGHLSQVDDIIRVHGIDEIIYSAQDVPFSEFTGSMTRLGPGLRYMLAASGTMNIVGSMSRDTEGESYAIRVHFNLSEKASRRAKRLFDCCSALGILLLSPILVLLVPKPLSLWQNALHVLWGNYSWVSYHPVDPLIHSLPPLRPGILHPAYPDDESDISRRLRPIHYVYARDYHWTTDLSILTSQIRRTSQRPATHE